MTKRQPPRKPDMNDLLKKKELTVAEVAQVLELARPTVYRLIEDEKSPLVVTRRKTATMGIFISTASVVNYARNVQLRNLPLKSN